MAVTEQLLFTKLESVSNQNSIHGIYPYRGKISSLDAANVISQLPHDKVLLVSPRLNREAQQLAQQQRIKVIEVENQADLI